MYRKVAKKEVLASINHGWKGAARGSTLCDNLVSAAWRPNATMLCPENATAQPDDVIKTHVNYFYAEPKHQRDRLSSSKFS